MTPLHNGHCDAIQFICYLRVVLRPSMASNTCPRRRSISSLTTLEQVEYKVTPTRCHSKTEGSQQQLMRGKKTILNLRYIPQLTGVIFRNGDRGSYFPWCSSAVRLKTPGVHFHRRIRFKKQKWLLQIQMGWWLQRIFATSISTFVNSGHLQE